MITGEKSSITRNNIEVSKKEIVVEFSYNPPKDRFMAIGAGVCINDISDSQIVSEATENKNLSILGSKQKFSVDIQFGKVGKIILKPGIRRLLWSQGYKPYSLKEFESGNYSLSVFVFWGYGKTHNEQKLYDHVIEL